MKNAIYGLSPETHHRQMNSLIVTTAEGKVIVIDGGWRADAEKLLQKLRTITGSEKPHVDAWFLSHAHEDHIDAFMELLERAEIPFTCDALYYNFPSLQFIARNEPGDLHTAEKFAELLPRFAAYARTVTEGDRYEIGSAAFDILYSPDPAFTQNAINNSSVVFRLTLGGKSVLFLGDAGIETGNKLLVTHGAALKSDICQMAHHGQNGVSREVYAAAAPEICLWFAPEWLRNNDRGKGFNTHIFQTVTVRGWMEELDVKTNYVTKDGDFEILL